MANTVIINVQANTAAATADITTTTVAVDNLTKSSQKLDTANKGTASSFEDVTKNGGAIAILDQMTGGLASRMRDTFEATKLFNFSLKGMRTAIIATGIGALVVAAALLVSYWDNIVGFFSGATSELKRQKEEYAEINRKSELKITLLKHEREIQKKLGKGVDDINKALEKELLIRQKSNKIRLKELKEIHDKELAQLEELEKITKGTFLFGGIMQGAKLKYLEDNKEALEEITALEKEELQIENDLVDLIVIKNDKIKKAQEDAKTAAALKKAELEELRIAQIDTVKEVREEELKQADLKYEALLEKARKYYADDSTQIKELERLQQDTKTELKLKHAEEDREAFLTTEQIKIQDQIDVNNEVIKNAEELSAAKKLISDKELEQEKAVAEAKASIRNAELDNIANGVNVLAKIAPKSKALQAASIVASNAVGITKIIQNTTAANAAAKLKYALIPGGAALAAAEIAANKVSAGINIATSIAATAKGLSALKAGGSAGTSVSLPSDNGGGAQQPQFNIVGQGAGSQIASALGEQQQTPVQAFVVSQDVTTAQSLENAIISGATLGG